MNNLISSEIFSDVIVPEHGGYDGLVVVPADDINQWLAPITSYPDKYASESAAFQAWQLRRAGIELGMPRSRAEAVDVTAIGSALLTKLIDELPERQAYVLLESAEHRTKVARLAGVAAVSTGHSTGYCVQPIIENDGLRGLPPSGWRSKSTPYFSWTKVARADLDKVRDYGWFEPTSA